MAGTRGYSKAFGLKLVAAALAAAGALALAAGTYAQQQPKLQVDPNVAQAKQPGVDKSGKAPVVNITTPGQGGVSHNVWKDYNVGKEGIVFNNATQAGQSQLMGQLGANPNLAGGNYAKLILNEVTGGNISQLLGYTEVFGHSADFILANPAGVTCNGCGFINTPRVTLTTGTPDFGADGSFKGFNVSGSGSIRFEGAGADITGLQTFDVVSRSIFMGGAIDDAALSAEVGLFAGRNSFDYAARTVTALEDDGSAKPGYGVDTNAAGAIRAGKIGITSTEKDVAARAAADMRATAGGMTLTADGKLVIAKAHSQGAIRAKSLSSNIQITDQVWSQATLDLRAGGNIAVLSQASAGALGDVSFDAQGITLNAGAVAGAGLDEEGKFTGSGALNLYAVNLTNAGTLQATGDVTLGLTGVLTNQGAGAIEAGQALTMSAAQATNAGQLKAQGALSANIAAGEGGDGSFANQGTASGASVAVSAGSLSNTGTLSAQGNLTASASGDLANTGSITAGGKLAANAANLANAGQMTATGDAAFNVSGTLANDATGKLGAGGALSIQAGAVKNYGGVDVSMPRGEISGLTLAISAGSVENAGNLLAAQGLDINASGQVANVLGTIKAGGYLSITAAGNVENLSGLIQGGDVAINAQTIENVTLVRRGSELIIPEEFTGILRVDAPGSAGAQSWAGLSVNGGKLLAGLLVKVSPAGSGDGGNGYFIEPGTAAAGAHTDVAAQQAEIAATDSVKLNASQDLNSMGGKFAAGTDLGLNAGGDVNVAAQELTSAKGSTKTVSHVKSTLSAGGNVTINAGGDATIKASDITSGKNTRITAQGAVTLGAAQDEYHEHWSKKKCTWYGSCKKTVVGKDDLTVVAATINSGGWVEIEAKTADILATATNVKAEGSIKLLSDLGNVLLEAGESSTYSHSYTKKSHLFGLIGSAHGSTDSTTTVEPTFVSAVNDVRIVSHADFVLKGSGVEAGGSIFVEAQNIQLLAMQNLTYHYEMTEKWGFFADATAGNGTAGVTLAWQDTTTTSSEWQSISQASSLQAGGDVSINAGGKLNVTGSTVTAAGDVSIKAAQVELAAAQDTVTKQESTTVDSFGLLPAMNNGLGFSIGAKQVSDESGQTQVTNIGALIGSTGGCVTIDAGETLTAQGSIIEALAGDVNITAGTIELGAGIDSFTTYAIHKEKFAGLNVSVTAGGANPLSAVQKGASFLSAAEKTSDPQAKLLYQAAAGVQAAQGALNAYNALGSKGGLTGALTSFSIQGGIGVSVSTSKTSASSEWASGGMVLAAGNLGMYATAGDLTLKGAKLDAFSVTLSAQRDILMQSLALTSTASSKSSSFSAFVGLEVGVGMDETGGLKMGGLSATANVSKSGAKSETVSITHAETEVSGNNWVTLTSGQDTNLYGAVVTGGGITAQVARNLNIVSDQDTERQTASQTSWSFGGSVGITAPSFSVNASYAQGKASGSYASVTTTSGLFAGGSGYAVVVGGTTTLTGAALASTADASKNTLTTAALVTKDLANSMSWKASSWGLSFSGSLTNLDGSQKGADGKPLGIGGTGGIQPGLRQKAHGESSGVAQATIAPGDISIVNAALQKSLTGKTPEQAITALNRSATALNKAADELPGGLMQTLQKQSDRSAAMAAASSSAARFVGELAATFQQSAANTIRRLIKESKTRQLTSQEKDELDAARQQLDLWGEGGPARIVLHGATQGVLAWLGGGYSLDAGLRGAGGAMLAQALAPRAASEAQKLLNEAGLGGSGQVTPGPLANLIAEAAITGFASAFGNVAAFTAASVDINNRQLHPAEIEFLSNKELIKKFAAQMGISEEAAAKLLAQGGASLVDSIWNSNFSELANIQEARDFILAESAALKFTNGQGFFRPSEVERNNFAMWASAALQNGGYAYYNRYLSVTDQYSNWGVALRVAAGAVKGGAYAAYDLGEGVVTLVTEPSKVWNGLKVIVSEPGKVADAAIGSFVRTADLIALYRMAGCYVEASALATEFTVNTVLIVDGVTSLPSVAKSVVSLSRTALSTTAKTAEVTAEVGEAVKLAEAAKTADTASDAAKLAEAAKTADTASDAAKLAEAAKAADAASDAAKLTEAAKTADTASDAAKLTEAAKTADTASDAAKLTEAAKTADTASDSAKLAEAAKAADAAGDAAKLAEAARAVEAVGDAAKLTEAAKAAEAAGSAAKLAEAAKTAEAVAQVGKVADAAKAAKVAGQAAQTTKLAKTAEELANAGKLAKTAEVASDTGKLAKTGEELANAGKVGRTTEAAPAIDDLLSALRQQLVYLSEKDVNRALSVGRSSQLGIDTVAPFENLTGSLREFAQLGKNWGGITRKLSNNTFAIADVDAFMAKISKIYLESGMPLTEQVAGIIRKYVSEPGKVFSGKDGIPGLHAEVQALNYFWAVANESKIVLDYSRLTIGTLRAPLNSKPWLAGTEFPACANCSGILPREINVPTGRIN